MHRAGEILHRPAEIVDFRGALQVAPVGEHPIGVGLFLQEGARAGQELDLALALFGQGVLEDSGPLVAEDGRRAIGQKTFAVLALVFDLGAQVVEPAQLGFQGDGRVEAPKRVLEAVAPELDLPDQDVPQQAGRIGFERGLGVLQGLARVHPGVSHRLREKTRRPPDPPPRIAGLQPRRRVDVGRRGFTRGKSAAPAQLPTVRPGGGQIRRAPDGLVQELRGPGEIPQHPQGAPPPGQIQRRPLALQSAGRRPVAVPMHGRVPAEKISGGPGEKEDPLQSLGHAVGSQALEGVHQGNLGGRTFLTGLDRAPRKARRSDFSPGFK